MSVDRALAAAIRARALADVGVQAIIGGRLYDDPPPDPIFPYLTIGRVERAQRTRAALKRWSTR